MRYLWIGLALMVTVAVSKLFFGIYADDVSQYSVESAGNGKTPEQLTGIGKSLYAVYCTSCHGSRGDGNNGKAQNHTRRISKESVLHAIKYGSNNFRSLYPSGMPGSLVNGTDAREVAIYVSKGLQGEKPKAWPTCAACHDESGEGILFVAPNIRSYSDDLVTAVLKNGKKGAIGTMPGFKNRLSDFQMKGLAHYIRSIQK